MKPEKQNLIHDLLDNDASRDAILLAGGRVLRRRRQMRFAIRSVGVLVVVAAVAMLFLRKESSPSNATQVASVSSKPSPVPPVQALTDEQLLSMFPSNTPVGLVSLADGKKRLIFPRAGDEQRFVTRL